MGAVAAPMDALASVLRATVVPATLFEPATYDRVLAFAVGVVESLGVRGLDAAALAQQVLSELREGPLDASGSVTLHAVLRHRLHLAALHWWRGERRRRAATARAAGAAAAGETHAAAPPPARLVADDDRARVRAALGRLPEADAQALRLLYFTTLPAERVRELLGYASLDVLYVRSSRARARLREILGGPSAP